jgi:hypothetical protein
MAEIISMRHVDIALDVEEATSAFSAAVMKMVDPIIEEMNARCEEVGFVGRGRLDVKVRLSEQAAAVLGFHDFFEVVCVERNLPGSQDA